MFYSSQEANNGPPTLKDINFRSIRDKDSIGRESCIVLNRKRIFNK